LLDLRPRFIEPFLSFRFPPFSSKPDLCLISFSLPRCGCSRLASVGRIFLRPDSYFFSFRWSSPRNSVDRALPCWSFSSSPPDSTCCPSVPTRPIPRDRAVFATWRTGRPQSSTQDAGNEQRDSFFRAGFAPSPPDPFPFKSGDRPVPCRPPNFSSLTPTPASDQARQLTCWEVTYFEGLSFPYIFLHEKKR